MIGPTSRYAGVERATFETPDGRTVPYLRRRFLPPPLAARDVSATVEVGPATRLDRVAAELQGDPRQAWRIADGNAALDPADLVATPGRRLRVPRLGG